MHTRKSLTVKDGILEEGTEIVQAEYEGLDSQNGCWEKVIRIAG